ncbi:MAG: 7TM domain-containing protein [Gemmataceae bacterium]
MGQRRQVIVTVAALVVLATGFGLMRFLATGEENRVPPGPGNFRVTLLVRGKAGADAKLITACPLEIGHQHIYGEDLSSAQLGGKVVETRYGERRQAQWSGHLGFKGGDFEARYQCDCTIDVRRPNGAMKRLQRLMDAEPKPGEMLQADPGVDPNTPEITATAVDAVGDQAAALDQARSLYQLVVDKIRREPATPGVLRSAQACLQDGRGDALAQSRLLVALLRNRGIPARLVHGLVLKPGPQPAHAWAEAWLGDRWFPLCPYHREIGKLPASYLVFGYGDLLLVRGYNLLEVQHGFLVEHVPSQAARTAGAGSTLARFFHRISLYNLPPAELALVEFLLLLPLAALMICFFRNIIGLQSFGTFTPALLALAFREVETWTGMLIFIAILLAGWGLRHGLDRFHLLQVPRKAAMLSLVVLMLIGLVFWANEHDLAATKFLPLFPLVILTGMIERFWTQETEDGTLSSFRLLLTTLLMTVAIAFVLAWSDLIHFLVTYPEAIGLILAAQVCIGRYTGYRLTEIWRFRELANEPHLWHEEGEPTSRAA